jgi:LysM repeat protein
MISVGNLVKLTLIGYRTNENLSPSNTTGTFVAQINPASISVVIGGTYNQEGEKIKETSFSGYTPPKVTFDLYVDSTGAYGLIKGNPIAVMDQIDNFKKVCYYYSGSEHNTPYVKLLWGAALMKYDHLDFIYRLESLTVNYTLFSPIGMPLRAKMSVAFVGDMALSTGLKVVKRSSPDLTHQIIVKAGDSLPNLCKKIYGDAGLYHHIARINKLTNFRSLTPGQQLEFPPIKDN